MLSSQRPILFTVRFETLWELTRSLPTFRASTWPWFLGRCMRALSEKLWRGVPNTGRRLLNSLNVRAMFSSVEQTVWGAKSNVSLWSWRHKLAKTRLYGPEGQEWDNMGAHQIGWGVLCWLRIDCILWGFETVQTSSDKENRWPGKGIPGRSSEQQEKAFW